MNLTHLKAIQSLLAQTTSLAKQASSRDHWNEEYTSKAALHFRHKPTDLEPPQIDACRRIFALISAEVNGIARKNHIPVKWTRNTVALNYQVKQYAKDAFGKNSPMAGIPHAVVQWSFLVDNQKEYTTDFLISKDGEHLMLKPFKTFLPERKVAEVIAGRVIAAIEYVAKTKAREEAHRLTTQPYVEVVEKWADQLKSAFPQDARSSHVWVPPGQATVLMNYSLESVLDDGAEVVISWWYDKSTVEFIELRSNSENPRITAIFGEPTKNTLLGTTWTVDTNVSLGSVGQVLNQVISKIKGSASKLAFRRKR
jgi:hypothetical protein